MKRSAIGLVLVCAFVALGCPGQKPPQAPAAAAVAPSEGPLVWHLSKSGLGFRLSNADEDADQDITRRVAPSTPLADADAKKIVARLPALASEPDDAKDFAMRDKSLPAPRPGKTVSEAFPPPPGPPPANVATSAPLTVERRAPEGPVDIAPHLTMTFSQPMVPITSMDDLAKEKLPVSLVPQPAGKWRWLGTKTLMFQPEKRFPMATEYAVDIPSGTKAMNGQALPKATQWTFSTPPVTVKRSFPSSGQEPLEPLIFAEMDQQIDAKALLGSVELAGPKGPVPIRMAEADEIEKNDGVRRLSQQAEKGRWIAFRPQGKLPIATGFTVRIKAGAPSAEGPRRTTKEQVFSFATYGPLKVERSYCSYGDKCPPLTPFNVLFTNTIENKSFDKSMVTVVPELPGLKVELHGRSLTISGRTKGRTKYEVTIDGAIADIHEQKLGNAAKLTFDVGSAEPQLFGAESDMVVLDPAAAKAYTVYSINEPGLHARVFSVGPEDWSKYVAYLQEWERPRKLRPPGRLVSDKMLTPRKAPDELVATPIELAAGQVNGLGQTVVIVEPTRTPAKGYHRAELDLWVQSTELGMNAYIENDQVTGWVTRLSDGTPENGVQVSLLDAGSAISDKDGLARVAFTQQPGKLLFAKKGKDLAIVPERYMGGHVYQTQGRADSARWLVYDDRGMYKPGEEVRVKGWLRRALTSRGGDLDAIPDLNGKTVSWKLRDPRWAEIGTGKTTVDDQGGFDLALKLPGNANLGTANLELSVEGVSVLGTTTNHSFAIQEFRRPEFEVTAKSSEGPHFVGRHAIATVSAAYYSGGGLPDAPVKWSVTRSTATFTPPNRGEYHFGVEPSFYWSWRSKPTETKTETWDSHTNPQGLHRLRVDFDALEPSYPMSLAMTAQVEDVNRQEWAGRTTMLVHPADHTVGVKLAKSFIRAGENIDLDLVVSDIDGKLTAGRAVTVKAARIDWQQQGGEYVEKELDAQSCDTKSASGDVRCTFKAANGGSWRVTAVVQDDHGRKSQTATQIYVMGGDVPKDRKLGAERVTIVPDKKEYKPGDLAEVLVIAPFVPAEGLLTIRRQGIVHVERITMKTAAQAIKVKLEEALVPNAEIRVDLVGASTRDDSSGKPDDKLPKRPAHAAGTMGLKILPVNRTLAVTAVAKKTAVEPGTTTQIDVDVKGPDGKSVSGAQVAVVVVDEAVLALSGYATPDPVAVFYAPRPSDVRELAVRDRVVLADPDLARLRPVTARAEMGPGGVGGEGFGSGSGRGALARPMAAPAASMPAQAAPTTPAEVSKAEKRKSAADKNGKAEEMDDRPSAGDTATGTSVADSKKPIALRSDFSALALFAPRVKTDGQGHASVPLKLPDNLTRYRVMAVVASGDRSFGVNESTLTARLPVMARLSAPRFLNFGDTFELPVIVQNQTDAPVEVGVVARATNATVREPSSKRVKVAPNDRVEVRFSAATVKPGTARFQIGIASGGFSDASQVELPVYTPATTEAFATYGEIDEGAMAQPVKMPPGVFTQFGGLEITTSSTQVQALTEAVLYLVKYPFECNEQIASRVMSIAALRDVLTAFKAEGLPKPAALEASMITDFEKLKRHQNGNGGWGFWQENPWPYLSIHVTHALTRAKDKGYKPDEEMLRRAQSYLRNVEAYIPSWYSEDARRSLIAYALFVRKRLNDADPGRAKKLIAEAGGVDKLPIEAIGWIWPTLSQDKNSTAENDAVRRHVSNRVTETAGNAHFVSGYKDADYLLLNSDRRADGILLESMIGDQKDNTIIPKLVKGLLAHRKAGGHWQNTNENAFVLLALDRYFNTYEKVTPDFVARVWLGDRFAGQHAFKGRTTEYSEVKVPMQWLATELKGQSQNLVIGKDGPGRLYYRVGMQYAPTDLKLPPADHGFVVSRLYEGADKPDDVKRDADGTWRVKAGSKVRIRVSMVAQSRRYHVALVDPIPAGLEPLNAALAVTGEIPKDPKAEAAAAKGGRYWYWNRTWYEHQNMRDERVEAFASLLYDGVWDYTYVAKATTPGVFVVPPPKAEEMYSPETFGRGAGDRMIVE